jgi:hypothetical protein
MKAIQLIGVGLLVVAVFLAAFAVNALANIVPVLP